MARNSNERPTPAEDKRLLKLRADGKSDASIAAALHRSLSSVQGRIFLMHQTAKFQFERTAREFAQWRAVPEDERSPAPAWWWQPALEVVEQHEEMGALLCYRLQLPVGSTYAAAVASQTEQIGMPLPRKLEPVRQPQPEGRYMIRGCKESTDMPAA